MLLNLVRWLLGYVCFKIEGKSPERFINITTKKRLSIWNTVKNNGVLYACMYVRDYKNVVAIARKSKVRLKIVSRNGLPFYAKKYNNRVGVLVGIAVFIAVVCFMSFFVWTIEVTGLESLSYSKLMSVLEDNGLYVGTFKPKTNFNVVSRNTMLKLPDIGWMSINVIGSHASVELKEKAKSPKVKNTHVPANVKAKRDGLILSINTSQGEVLFESGSAVVKDQMLVCGVIEDQLGGVKLVQADAQVIAQTTRKETFSISKDFKVCEFKKPKVRKTLEILKFKIPFAFSFADESVSAVCTQTDSLYVLDTFIPVSVNTTRLYEKAVSGVKLSDKKAHAILKTYATLYQSFELKDAKVLNRSFMYLEDELHYFLECTFICEEDIAYQQEIDAENFTIEDAVNKEKGKTQ